MRTAAISLAVAALAAVPSMRAADGFRATVKVGTQRASSYDLVGRTGDKISMTPVGVGGVVSMGMSSIASMQIERPKPLDEATFLLGAGKTADALTRLRNLARQLMPYTAVPNNNAVDLICDVVDLLRSADQYAEALEILRGITRPGEGSNAGRVELLRAYCLSSLGKTLEAEDVLRKTKPRERGDPLYPVAKIVRSRVSLTTSNINQALDEIAQAIVDSPIESEYYPEALFIAGSSYQALANQATPEKTTPQPGGKSDADRIMQEGGSSRTAASECFTLLVQMAPQSRWAELAKARLKELGAEAPPVPAESAPPPATDGQGAAPAGAMPPAAPQDGATMMQPQGGGQAPPAPGPAAEAPGTNSPSKQSTTQ